MGAPRSKTSSRQSRPRWTARASAPCSPAAPQRSSTGGEYDSDDLDFILQSSPSQESLDRALSEIGFSRKVDHYVHKRTDFFLEFPRGPLSIGRDLGIQPVEVKVSRGTVVILSATDSCRDRLAAFYHWSDRQSLETAVRIAQRNRVDMKTIREWSAQEGMADKFEQFDRELRRSRKPTRE